MAEHRADGLPPHGSRSARDYAVLAGKSALHFLISLCCSTLHFLTSAWTCVCDRLLVRIAATELHCWRFRMIVFSPVKYILISQMANWIFIHFDHLFFSVQQDQSWASNRPHSSDSVCPPGGRQLLLCMDHFVPSYDSNSVSIVYKMDCRGQLLVQHKFWGCTANSLSQDTSAHSLCITFII